MGKKPIVSVLMSVYNEPINYIKLSIESILKQTFQDFEFIIINDNPKREDIKELFTEYQKLDNRIIILENKKNLGLPQSLNKGLRIARGKFIARMDADDISLPDRLKIQKAFLEKSGNHLIGGWMYEIDYKGMVLGEKKLPQYFKDLKKIIRKCKTIAFHPTWFGYKYVFLDLQGYRNIKYAEDFDFLIRLILRGYTVGNIPEFVLKYRTFKKNVNLDKVVLQYLTGKCLCDYYNKNTIPPIEELLNIVKNKASNKINYLLLKISLGNWLRFSYYRKKRNYFRGIPYLFLSLLHPIFFMEKIKRFLYK